jgi:hypothetical protein
LANPDGTGWLLMTLSARPVSGWRSRNAFIVAGSGLPVSGIGFGSEELLVERLRRAERKDRQVDHRRSPELTVGHAELEPQAAYRAGVVRGVRLAAGQEKKRPSTGTRPGSKDRRLRQPRRIPVALEEARHSDALGVIATKAGVDAVHVLERVGEPGRRQISRREPSAEIGEAPATAARTTPIRANRTTCARYRSADAAFLMLPSTYVDIVGNGPG